MYLGNRRLVTPLFAPPAVVASSGDSLAKQLVSGETDALGLDFTDMSGFVVDTSTPANDFDGDANDLLTYTGPSTKWIRLASGLFESGTTLRTEYDVSSNALGILIEEQRTWRALHNRDFSNAAWSKTNTTATQTATGIDGVSNAASVVTATANNGTVLQSITSASTERISSCFVKRRTGTGTIEMTQDNGSTWTNITSSINSSTYTRVNVAAQTIANPTVGFRIGTSGDAIDVDFFGEESGSFITSPVSVAGSSVTRSADDITLATADFPYALDNFSYFANFNASPSEVLGYVFDTDTTRVLMQFSPATTLRAQSTATPSNLFATQTGLSDGDFKVALGYAEDDAAFSVNGASVTTDSSASALDTQGADLHFGKRNSNSSYQNLHLKQFSYVPRRKTNTELETETT